MGQRRVQLFFPPGMLRVGQFGFHVADGEQKRLFSFVAGELFGRELRAFGAVGFALLHLAFDVFALPTAGHTQSVPGGRWRDRP